MCCLSEEQMNIENRPVSLSWVVLLIGTLVVSVFSNGRLDTSFSAALIKAPGGFANETRIQPDGKIITYGSFRSVNGEPGSNLIRLNPDGSTDISFRAPSFSYGLSPAIKSIELQSDGKIIVSGVFDRIGGVVLPQRGIARLNQDGSLDPTFLGDPSIPTILADVYDMVVLADDKIIVGNVNGFARLLPNGSLDSSFSSTHRNTPVITLGIQPDGKILGMTSNGLRRFNADGTTDAGFTMSQFSSNVYDIKVRADGKIMVSGQFTHVNGFLLPQLARFNSDGSVDTTFVNQFVNTPAIVHRVIPLPDGKAYILGGMTTVHAGVDVHRLNADGSIDTSFNGIPSSGWDMDLQPDGKIIVSNDARSSADFPRLLYRLNPDGSGLDHTFAANFGVEGIGHKIFVQPDGKILVGGRFNFGNNSPREAVARFRADGTIDPTFNVTSLSPDTTVSAIDMQPDGKIVINAYGVFAEPPEARRLHPDGSLDVAFPGSAWATSVKVLADGKILISGANYVKRYNSNGSLDAAFAPTLDAAVLAMAVQPDGKVLIVGSFTAVNGIPRGRIARLNENGTLDTTFDTSTGANSDVRDVALQGDGKVVIGGSFSGVNFATRGNIARLNSNGTLDTGFNPSAGPRVDTIKIQRDNKILIGGLFSQVNASPRDKIARLHPDGTVDPGFSHQLDYYLVSNETVRDIEVQSDGKILMTSDFNTVDGVRKLAIARFHSFSIPFDYDGDGRADVSVARAAENRWYILRTSDAQVDQPFFGVAGDMLTPADYDGDGKTDVAIYRPSNGQWWYRSSLNGALVANTFGQSGDVPRPSDFDGDGNADLVLFRPSDSTWYRFGSLAGQVANVQFGIAGDQPVVGDFDGDGRSDLAVFRPSNGDWWYAASSAGGQFRNVHWGQTGDLPVPADYDGDGKTDYAVYRPSQGGWYVYNSGNGSFTTVAFGTSGDRPVAADYDGDGRADIAVFRPSTGLWYLLRSTSGFAGVQFGISTDTATPGSFVP
jgi:uncharacterized delta-60 repeat protein